jgi:hypothetical protein
MVSSLDTREDGVADRAAAPGDAERCCRQVDRRECGGALGEEGRDRRMGAQISGATLCPSDDLITGVWLDRPRDGCPPGWRDAAANPGLYTRPCSQSWLPVPTGNMIGAI